MILCAFKNGLRHKRAQTITSTWGSVTVNLKLTSHFFPCDFNQTKPNSAVLICLSLSLLLIVWTATNYCWTLSDKLI